MNWKRNSWKNANRIMIKKSTFCCIKLAKLSKSGLSIRIILKTNGWKLEIERLRLKADTFIISALATSVKDERGQTPDLMAQFNRSSSTSTICMFFQKSVWFFGGQCTASIYRNVCQSVSADYKKVWLLVHCLIPHCGDF